MNNVHISELYVPCNFNLEFPMSIVFKIHEFLIKNISNYKPQIVANQTTKDSFRSIHIHKFQSYEFRVSFSHSFCGCCCCRQCTHCTK